MEADSVSEQLREFVGSGKKVRLTRAIPSQLLHNGIALAMGREWVVLQQFHDFYPEGYTALRLKDITDIRSDKYERHWEHMLAEEGVLNQVVLPYELPLDDISQLLRALQQRGDNVIVECEDMEDDIEDFYIGKILSVDDGSVFFVNFDGLGKWDEEPATIPLDEITQVQFDTPYVRTFSKYLEGPCPHFYRCTFDDLYDDPRSGNCDP